MKTATLLVPVLFATACNLKPGAKGDDAGLAAAATDAAPTVAAAAPADSASAHPATPAPKSAPPPSASAATKAGPKVPTCTGGQILVTDAMSPFKPRCALKCKADKDCKSKFCMESNLLGPGGAASPDGATGKVCAEAAADDPPAPKGAAPAGKKCAAGQHYDAINKKCRPLGDCPDGYRWNEPMQSCLDNGG